MKQFLLIIFFTFLLSGYSFAEKKFLLCKDKSITPQLMPLINSKNDFFPEDGEVLTISYKEDITKIWADNMSYIFQFTLFNDVESYKFEYPKNVFDASTPSLLNFKEKSFIDFSSGDKYKFLYGFLNKMTLEGSISYQRLGPIDLHPFSKTRDNLNINFKCKIVEPKI